MIISFAADSDGYRRCYHVLIKSEVVQIRPASVVFHSFIGVVGVGWRQSSNRIDRTRIYYSCRNNLEAITHLYTDLYFLWGHSTSNRWKRRTIN